MGLFSGQFANVVEWQEYRDDMLFWKWSNKEIKKGSRLIIRPGQDAIFLYNGKVEGIFRDEGSYDIESAIIPFLSTLKGFKFGFNSGLRRGGAVHQYQRGSGEMGNQESGSDSGAGSSGRHAYPRFRNFHVQGGGL